MTLHTHRPPPSRLARTIGVLLLALAAVAIFAELGVRSTLVIPGDAQATAERILGSESLFRLGFVGYLIAFLIDVPVAILFYVLLRHAGRTHALLATAFRLVYTAIVAAILLPYLGAVLLLGGADVGSAFDPSQLQALAAFLLDLFDNGFTLALTFFGMHLALLGMLLYRSRQVPRVLAVLVAAGGAGYVFDSLAFFLAPELHATISPILVALAMAELLLALWLVAMGARPPQSHPA